ncbi:MAG: cysteine synthase A [Clostridia bacterium]|jgi:cysteine synthase A|nr:cysteine synthase A [Clostridia bacterium]
MARIFSSVEELIGRTPMIELKRIEEAEGLSARLLAKLEKYNPGGSVKDRVALNMIKEAEDAGLLKKGSVIIEPTSGNTGIGLALAASLRGYRTVIVMPETMSLERRRMLAAYGAEIVLTEGSRGMSGAIEKAEELAESMEGSFIPSQFDNPANPRAHEKTTGPEIWDDTEGKVDIFVAGVGTGGTLTGVGRYLKSRNPAIAIVAVEPASSPVLSAGVAGPHGLQGIGAGFVPKVLDMGLYDGVMPIRDEDAYEMGRRLCREEGLFVGITSGAAVAAAVELAKRHENQGKTIVALLPDDGGRYLSTEMFAK